MLIFIIFLIVLCDHLVFQCRKVYVAFYHFTLLFIFFYFQDLSENHPGERVSWLNIIIYIIIIIIFFFLFIFFLNNLNFLLIRKPVTTKSGLFTIKFCFKKTIQYKYYLQFISIKKTHIVPIKKFISIKNRYSNTNTNTNTNTNQY